MSEFWIHLGERYRDLPGPWWAVFAIYETLILSAWILEYLLLRRIRSRSGDPIQAGAQDRQYRGWWLWHFLALQFPLYRTGRWSTLLPLTWTTVQIGTGIAIAGILFRLYSIWCLRENFSYVVYVGDRHRLVKRGIYKYLRHPAYLGLLVFSLGIPVVVCDSLSIAVIMAYVGPMIGFRMRREELALRAEFGEEYEEWLRTTKRLIPFVL